MQNKSERKAYTRQTKELHHGIQAVEHFTVNERCTDSICSEKSHEYLFLLPGKCICRYSFTGIQSGAYQLRAKFSKFLYVEFADIFLGWTPNETDIFIFNQNFREISVIEGKSPLINVLVDYNFSEIVVVGNTQISTYRVMSQTLAEKRSFYFSISTETCAKIEHTALVYFHSKAQELFASFFKHGCIIDIENKSAVRRKNSLHFSRITAVYFHKPLTLLFTGDDNGTILGWSSHWRLKMKLHISDSVKFLTSLPISNDIIAMGNQCGIIIWSMLLSEKTQQMELTGTVRYFTISFSNNYLITTSDKTTVWHYTSLYHVYFQQSVPVINLFTSCDSSSNFRSVVVSSDSVIRIISPLTGKQLTTLSTSCAKETCFISYSVVLDTVYFVSHNQRKILPMCCKENPPQSRKILNLPDDWPVITSFTVFETSTSMQFKAITNIPPKTFCLSEYVLIIIGFIDGKIAVVQPMMKKKPVLIDCHQSSVLKLITLHSKQSLLSYEKKSIIKIWKVSFLSEHYSILLSMTLFYPTTIAHIANIGEILCLAVNHGKSANHVLLMYNFETKERWEHPQCEDHHKDILDISTNESLRICATSSADTTIRIWNYKNYLQKILFLNAVPNLISISSPRGDILVSIGKNLCKIFYQCYLCEAYHKTDNNLQHLEDETLLFKREKLEKNIISSNESNENIRKHRIYDDPRKRQEINHYISRNKEIEAITEGKLFPMSKLHKCKYCSTLFETELLESNRFPKYSHVKASLIHISSSIMEMHEKQKEKILCYHNKLSNLSGGNISLLRSLYPPPLYQIPNLHNYMPNSVAYKMLGLVVTEITKVRSAIMYKEMEQTGHYFFDTEDSKTEDFETINFKYVPVESYIPTSELKQSYTQIDGMSECYIHTDEMNEETGIKNILQDLTERYDNDVLGCITGRIMKDVLEGDSLIETDSTLHTDSLSHETSEIFSLIDDLEKRIHEQTEIKNKIGDKNLQEKCKLRKQKEKEAQRKKSMERKHKQKVMKYTTHGLEIVKVNNEDNVLIPVLNNWQKIQEDNFQNVFTDLQSNGVISKEHKGENNDQILYILLMESFKGNRQSMQIVSVLAYMNNKVMKYLQNQIHYLLFKTIREPRMLANMLKFILIMKFNDITTTAALLVQYVISSENERKLIFQYFTSIGLFDPGNVLEEYRNDWKKDLFKLCQNKMENIFDGQKAIEIVKKWLQHWMNTLECHVDLILKLLVENNEFSTYIDPFLLDKLERIIERNKSIPLSPHSSQSSIVESTLKVDVENNVTEMSVIVNSKTIYTIQGHIQSIEGLNYFCEVHSKGMAALNKGSLKHSQTCFSDIQNIPEDKLSNNLRAHEPWQAFIHRPLSTVQVGNANPYPTPVLLTLRTSQKYFWPEMSVVKKEEMSVFKIIM